MLLDPGLSVDVRQFVPDALSTQIAVLDEQGVIISVNLAWRDFGAANGLASRKTFIGESYLELCGRTTGEDARYARAAADGIHDVLARRRMSFELEYPCHTPTEQRWFILRATMFECEGRRWVVLAHENITARRLAEISQQRLAGELGHRLKNTVTLIQAIANQTLRQSVSLDDFAAAFNARLAALTRAHALLADDWQTLSLQSVIEAALEPHRIGNREALAIDGPDVEIPAELGLSLSIVFHELATNAAKYGALSLPAGKVKIHWHAPGSREGTRVTLVWEESGGPAVHPPTRRGFGTTMIEDAIAHQFGGTARLDFRASGIRYDLDVPLSRRRALHSG
jgi:two-component sensor histidine kinase